MANKYWRNSCDYVVGIIFIFYQLFTGWILCQYYNISMWLVRLNMRVIVEINGIFSIKWGYYGLKDIFWTIGSYSYFCITPSYIPSRNKCYRG